MAVGVPVENAVNRDRVPLPDVGMHGDNSRFFGLVEQTLGRVLNNGPDSGGVRALPPEISRIG